ncbi:hypothetical protein [Halostella litorea]|uniref:hypothetical protein n=1 Tax=Halostella litorea TaxID=2528831 RepID=UPI001091BB3E|nr:hypothetical protein [Halostella litorea]
MAVGLLFGAFWTGLGILMWWWPAAVFVAFSNEEVTPGARGFAVGAVFLGTVFLSFETTRAGVGVSVPATVAIVGGLLAVKPVRVPGTDERGPVTPKRVGATLLVGGAVITALSAV